MQRSITSFLLMICAVAYDAGAQSAPARLQHAQHMELVAGDLVAAADLYRNVSESVATPRNYVANALFRLGRTLEQMGDAIGASEAYVRVISDFGDQAEPFREAQLRLRAMGPADTGSTPHVPRDYELILSNLGPFNPYLPPSYDFSSDGSSLVSVGLAQPQRKSRFPRLFRELYIQDLRAKTAPRPLFDDVGAWEFIGVPRLSPDESHLYFIANGDPGGPPKNGAFIADLGSGAMVHVGAVESPRDAVWLPDGLSLLIEDGRDIVLVDLQGRELKRFETVLNRLNGFGTLSRDGRVLVFHTTTDIDAPNQDKDIFTLDLDSGEKARVTDRNGVDAWPVWDYDGRSIIFSSDRDGAMNLYRRSPSGAVSRLTTYTNSDAIYPRLLGSGDLSFALINTSHAVMLSETTAPDQTRMVARGGGPTILPDGSAIIYGDESGTQLRRVDIATGESTVLLERKVSSRRLSPDGRSIAGFIFEGDDTVLYRIPTDGSDPLRLYTAKGRQELDAGWSPDGTEIAFTDEERLLVIPSDGGRPQVLAEMPSWEGWSLAWSPDGTRIAAFAYAEGETENHVAVVDRATGSITRATPPEESDYKEGLHWHPDGHHLSYMYYGAGRRDGSRIVNLDTGVIESLPDLPDPMWDYVGTWGPDGRYWFTATPRGTGNAWGIFALDRQTGSFETIRYDEDRTSWIPSWSADGRLMTWTDETRTRQLWRLTDY